MKTLFDCRPQPWFQPARTRSRASSVTVHRQQQSRSRSFTKGMPYRERASQVHACRHEVPGPRFTRADTDIVHVLEGSATLVTGGAAVEPKTIAPDEIRGKQIQGGEIRRMRKGRRDCVPMASPHWFNASGRSVALTEYVVIEVARRVRNASADVFGLEVGEIGQDFLLSGATREHIEYTSFTRMRIPRMHGRPPHSIRIDSDAFESIDGLSVTS